MAHGTQKLIRAITSGLLLLVLGMAKPAAAEPDADNNFLQIIDIGELNQLTILQVKPNSSHRANVTVVGGFNGGESAEFRAHPAWFARSRPGLITQSGFRQEVTLEVFGKGNLFSITQTGALNVAQGFISGTGNQAAISQAGKSNHATFRQIGTNNHIAINQSM
ncbi:hypothetical protein [Sulfitobacter sp. 915]|uniref:hypothetical protein n=1 Tax=Sulfitobacter sp. 915 TaxID=3368558 RepID=UPI0037460BAA